MNVSLNRRDFAKGVGGLVLAFTLDPAALAQDKPKLPGSLDNNRMLDAWIRLNPDGTATVFTGKVELGQGILTALAQIAAEELDLPLARVTMVTGDTGRTPNEGVTSGSQSIENSGTALRLAAAEVQAILRELAAPKLDAFAAELSIADGGISATNLKEARESLEREMVQGALRKHGGKVTSAALELGVSRPTLYELMEKLGIVRN